MNNYGLILQTPQLGDYIFGGDNGFLKEKYTSDWNIYLPQVEYQIGLFTDTKACVSFSALNCIEAILNYKIKNGLIRDDNLKWLKDNGYIENGSLEFSDRFIAIKSGTTKIGNSGYNVANSIRKYGLIPESLLPFDRLNRDNKFDWDKYYSDITSEMEEVGQEFIKRFSINYEIVLEKRFEEALLYSPLQAFVVAWYQKDGEYYIPENKVYNHAVVKFNNENKIYDSYDPFIKKLKDDYKLYNVGFTYFINEWKKTMSEDTFLIENDLKLVRNSDTGEFGWIYDKKIRVPVSQDRGALMALAYNHRKDGITIDNQKWSSLPVVAY